MVTHYFHFVGIAILPFKADPELVVDADAVLIAPSAYQLLQVVSRRNSSAIQILYGVKLALRLSLYVTSELPDGPSFRDISGVPVSESLNHLMIIVSCTNSARRN